MIKTAVVAFMSCIRRKFIRGSLLVSSLLIAGMISLPAMGADRDRDPGSLVWTKNGPVRGLIENGVRKVPHAAPPGSIGRWARGGFRSFADVTASGEPA